MWLLMLTLTLSVFEAEYRMISLQPTCLGNLRVRVTADGQVVGSVNTEECEDGQFFSAPLKPLEVLNEAARAALVRAVVESGFFDLPPRSEDPRRKGGFREELDVRLGERRHTVVVQNTSRAEFRAVADALRGLMPP